MYYALAMDTPGLYVCINLCMYINTAVCCIPYTRFQTHTHTHTYTHTHTHTPHTHHTHIPHTHTTHTPHTHTHTTHTHTYDIQSEMVDLSQHFQCNKIETHMFASQWFLTIFTAKFPLCFVYRVMDVFLCDVSVGHELYACSLYVTYCFTFSVWHRVEEY